MLERRWWEIKSSFQSGPLTRGMEWTLVTYSRNGICTVCFMKTDLSKASGIRYT